MGVSVGPSAAEAKQQIPEMERRHKLCPSNLEITHHLGVMYFQSGRVEEAIPLFQEVYDKDRTQPVYSVNLANALKDMGQMERVLELSQIAYEKDGGQQWSICLAYAESLMREGKYHKAWPIYEKGRFTRIQTQLMMSIGEAVPEWKGQKIDGPLLVLGEGGWGDRINYSRFLPWINDRGVPYFCMIDSGANPGQTVLTDLFNRLPWIDRTQEGKQQVETTHWVTTFSLMSAFDIGPEDIPPPARWYADPARVEAMKFIRSKDERPTVGLVWSAGEVFEGDRKVRSLTEWEASRLVAQTEDRVHWVNLQYDWRSGNMVNPPHFNSWDDTAAAVSNCDLVITVDTGPLHLANSLGIPTWCLLSSNADWKWKLKGQSPWYPSMRLFRNGVGRGYPNSLAELTEALREGQADEYKSVGEVEVSTAT